MENLKHCYFRCYYIVLTSSSIKDSKKYIDVEFGSLNKHFKANWFCLNINERHFIQFAIKVSLQIDLGIHFANKLVSAFYGTEFFERYLHGTLSSKMTFEQIEHKWSAAWYVNSTDKPFISQDTLKIVYNILVHSFMNCGLIYRWDSSHNVNIFNIQKIMFRIITGSIIRDLFRYLFTSASAFTIYTAHFVFVANSKNNLKFILMPVT